MHFKRKIILSLSLSLCLLIIYTGCTGLLVKDFYLKETTDWKLQSVVQDAIDLFFVAPLLMLTGVFASKKRNWFLMWGGVNLYLVYTYTIYCFGVHFNSLFLVYCLSLGLSFYSFLYFLFTVKNKILAREIFHTSTIKITAVYFIISAVLFYLLWLSEIVPYMFKHQIPQSLQVAGLPTNPVHVLDLSVILPAIFITAIFLLRERSIALLLAPVLLSFFILMDITIAAIAIVLNIVMKQTGYTISITMMMLAFFSSILLKQIFNLMPAQKPTYKNAVINRASL